MIGNGKLYVFVNSELEMSEGKAAAQVAHAVARAGVSPPRIVIILDATTEQLHNLSMYIRMIKDPNLKQWLYIDEGVNEVPPLSATALAVGLFEEEFIPDFLRGFKLHSKEKRGFFR